MAAAHFGQNSVYADLFGRAVPIQAPNRDDLPVVGLAYRFSPDNVPFDGRAKLALRIPAGPGPATQLAVYELKSDTAWAFLGNSLNTKDGTISVKVAHFSTYALLRDAVPPEIRDVRPAHGSKVGARPLLDATILDGGSGVGREEDITMSLDGERLIAEYDPERDRVEGRLRRKLDLGPHRFVLTVRDMCGNESRAVSVFVVRRD
jgi:hypothetical protein